MPRCPQCDCKTLRESVTPCALCRPYNWATVKLHGGKFGPSIAKSGDLIVYEEYYDPHEDYKLICADAKTERVIAVKISGRSLSPEEKVEFGVR